MESELFVKWLEVVFIPGIETLKKPVFLLVDGHSSHTTLHASTCRDNDIIMSSDSNYTCLGVCYASTL